jgi:hypothetical protein
MPTPIYADYGPYTPPFSWDGLEQALMFIGLMVAMAAVEFFIEYRKPFALTRRVKTIAIVIYFVIATLSLNQFAKSQYAQSHIPNGPFDHEWDWCSQRPGGC